MKIEEMTITGVEAQSDETAIYFTEERGAVLLSKKESPEDWQYLVDNKFDMTVTHAFLQMKAAAERIATAHAGLVSSDTTFNRCGKAGVAWPDAWKDYVIALRAFLETDGTGDLPTKPDYPEGT
ncbi:MAG: hypothetical protein GC185_01935 [Alphaproteobacteria bacterium]|nr:hypothetical protein [Alphaproteobacteria bacterium]